MYGFERLRQILVGLVKAVGVVAVIMLSVMAFFGLVLWLCLWGAK